MIKLISYDYNTKSFSIAEPLNKVEDSYRVISKDIRSNKIISKTIKTDNASKAIQQFRSSESLKSTGRMPSRMKAFKTPQQDRQSSEYKDRLINEDKNKKIIQNRTIL